jgi:hypothetical protein
MLVAAQPVRSLIGQPAAGPPLRLSAGGTVDADPVIRAPVDASAR